MKDEELWWWIIGIAIVLFLFSRSVVSKIIP